MDVYKLLDYLKTLPEDDAYRIEQEADIAKMFDRLNKGEYTRCGPFEDSVEDKIDYTKIYVAVYNCHEIYDAWLEACSLSRRDLEDNAKKWLDGHKSCGNAADYKIYEIPIDEEKARIASDAWKHNITPLLWFKVELEHKEDFVDYYRIVNVLHGSGVNENFDNCLDILSCPFVYNN